MNLSLNKNLKIAIQKDGRLSEDSINLLISAGLDFDNYKQKLFTTCRNLPIEIIYLRDDDIPECVDSGVVDLGIVGKNVLYENEVEVKELLDLGFGFCSLCIAVPKESTIQKIEDFKNLRIATTFPLSTKKFFEEKKIPVEIIKINGSVEISPSLGISDAIVDIVSTGSSLAMNDLRKVEKIYDTEAVLIANKFLDKSFFKKDLVNKLIMRLNGVLDVNHYKYVMMNAPKKSLEKIKKVVPGLKSPTIASLASKDWISIQTVIREDIFWETVEKLKELGATGILVLPIEKLIA